MKLDNPVQFLVKVLTATRLENAASGNVAYTGVGFKPKGIFVIACRSGTNQISYGFSDAILSVCALYPNGVPWYVSTTYCIYNTGNYGVTEQKASVLSFDNDGFTLAWVLVGAPPGGTIDLLVLCLG